MLIFFLSICQGVRVFIVPHSHIDAGWIDKLSVYQKEHFEPIFGNVLDLLENNKNYTFCWSETIWLSFWLKEHPEDKDRIKDLVRSGQIEIAGGGWVMHDEALTDFESVSRQIETGHSFLYEELGVKDVKVAWQLDPFGHSSLTPAILEKLGFQYLVIGRIDGNYRTQLKEENLEFVWKSQAFGAERGVLTHVLSSHYNLPSFLDHRYISDCFPDEENDTYYNVTECYKRLKEYVSKVRNEYRTDNLMILYGDDIYFKNMTVMKSQFSLIDDLRSFSNDLDIQFSTPSKYFASVLNHSKKFDVFQGDLLPYVSEDIRQRPISWTGFFSSRPGLKQKIFETHFLVRTAELLQGLVFQQDFNAFEACLSLHHDAVTGTCQPIVFDDYMERLAKDEERALNVINTVYNYLKKESSSSDQLSLPYRVFIIFNPINWAKKQVIEIPVSGDYFVMFNSDGKQVFGDVIQLDDQRKLVIYLDMNGLQFQTFFLVEANENCDQCSRRVTKGTNELINTGKFEVLMDRGLLKKIWLNGNEFEVDESIIKIDANYSGAYEFRPIKESEKIGKLKKFSSFEGEKIVVIKTEIEHEEQVFKQVLIFPRNEEHFIFKFKLTPNKNEEVFIKLSAVSQNFYTFNSADFIKKSTYNNRFDCYGENNFPVVGAFFLDYFHSFLQVYPRFPLGVMVTHDSVNLHLHRNPANDDVLGLGSPLNDSYPAVHEFFITFSEISHSKTWKNYLNHRNPFVLFSLLNDSQLSPDLNRGDLFEEKWTARKKYQILPDNECLYISRVFFRGNVTVFSVLNVCEKTVNIEFENIQIFKELFLNGGDFELRELDVVEEDFIRFDINQNYPENILTFNWTKGNGIGPFELRTFAIEFSLDLSEKSSEAIQSFLLTENTGQVAGLTNQWIYIAVWLAYLVALAYVIWRFRAGYSTKKYD